MWSYFSVSQLLYCNSQTLNFCAALSPPARSTPLVAVGWQGKNCKTGKSLLEVVAFWTCNEAGISKYHKRTEMTCGLYVTLPMVYKTSFWELFFKMHNTLTFKKHFYEEEPVWTKLFDFIFCCVWKKKCEINLGFFCEIFFLCLMAHKWQVQQEI